MGVGYEVEYNFRDQKGRAIKIGQNPVDNHVIDIYVEGDLITQIQRIDLALAAKVLVL